MIYHKDVYIPPALRGYQFSALLKYSRHAIQESINDERGEIKLPKIIDSRDATLVEIEVNEGKVTKTLFRLSYSDEHDLCLVIIPENRVVKTVWLNNKDDHHKTLDRSKYATT